MTKIASLCNEIRPESVQNTFSLEGVFSLPSNYDHCLKCSMAALM